MPQFIGFVTLGSTISASFVTRDSATGTPYNAAALPTFRVYGAAGLMTNGTGTSAFKDSKSISGATNASPIVIASNSHGLQTGVRVTIEGAVGNTAANGTWNITRIDNNTFSLDSSTGNGAYTSGGTWKVTGLYSLSVAATSANGYESGKTFFILWSAANVNSNAVADVLSFTVV